MPKQTFYHLPNEKREALINAAMKEFSRVPLFEASISNIIKDAGIPRGSFYQYFEDKDDVFFYLLSEYSQKTKEKFNELIRENNGDLFEAFLEFFKYMLTFCQNKESCHFLRNAFSNMTFKVENAFTQNMNENNYKNKFLKTLELINTEKLNISDERELFHVIKIMMAVTIQNLIRSFVKELPFDESVNIYSLELSLLKKGFYKNGI